MIGWKSDKEKSDRYLPEIKSILGRHLIGEPPIEDDQERNTDLIVLKMDAVRIACRIRSHSYLERYPNEFTIRSARPSGVKTELTKIIEGWGDYFFYGFGDETESSLAKWSLCDLKVFRWWFNRRLVEKRGVIPGIEKPNGDGSSNFRAFVLTDLPPNFVVACSEMHATVR